MAGRALLGLILGLLGGLFGFLLQEPLVNHQLIMQSPVRAGGEFTKLALVLGAVLGLFLGGADHIARRETRQALRAAVKAALICMPGSWAALTLGSAVYTALSVLLGNPAIHGGSGPLSFVLDLLPRTLGWTVFGAATGAAVGAASGSWRRTWHAAVGGVLGGALGGVAFVVAVQLFGWLMASLTAEPGQMVEVGGPGRGVGLTVLGGAIGLFVSLMRDALKSAWVEVILARNEWIEYPIDKPVNTVGRAETSDVPLFGDPQVAPLQAQIISRQGGWVLENLHAATPVSVNSGAPGPLTDGDIIRVSGFTLRFRERVGRVTKRQRDAAPAVQPVIAASDGRCSWCGEQPDPTTGLCRCASRPSAPSGLLRPVLRVVGGPQQGAAWTLTPGVYTLGRDAAATIRIDADPSVSRQHARLDVDASGVVVSDIGSANGTWVNGVRITSAPLHRNDTIQLGSTLVRLEDGGVA